jgi:hypothetical protein
MKSKHCEQVNSLVEATVEVDLTWINEKIEHKIVFGDPIAERYLDPYHKTLSFSAQSIFAVLRWASCGDGRTVVRLEIIHASNANTRVPFVRPAVDLLLRAAGWTNVLPVLRIIDGMRAAEINPTDVAPDYWVHVGSRIATGERPRPYTRTRHLVWQLRRKIDP